MFLRIKCDLFFKYIFLPFMLTYRLTRAAPRGGDMAHQNDCIVLVCFPLLSIYTLRSSAVSNV
jgi:hypothetical protein